MRSANFVLMFALIMFVAAVACRRQTASTFASAGAPAIDSTPIGPLPGVVESAEREPQNPVGDDPNAMADGQRLFMAFNCAGCHGDHGGGGMGPSLRDEDWIYGSTDAKVASSIASGRAHGMPAWGVMLTAEQVWRLTAYIKSMRTSREPNAPPPG